MNSEQKAKAKIIWTIAAVLWLLCVVLYFEVLEQGVVPGGLG